MLTLIDYHTQRNPVGLEKEAAQAKAFITSLVIQDQAAFEDAADKLSLIKGKIKEIEEGKELFTRPLKQEAKRIEDAARPALDFLWACELYLKRIMSTYLTEQRIKQDEDMRALTAAVTEGNLEHAREISQTVSVYTPPKAETVRQRDDWKFEILNSALLPREYLIPDEKTIRAVVKSRKGGTVIPGVRVWNEIAIASLSK